MELMTDQKKSYLNPPEGSKIIVSQDVDKIIIDFPANGLKGKGLATVFVIGLWLLSILIWSLLLLAMNPVNVLYSLPFWAIGIITLVKSTRILILEQSVTVSKETVSLKLKRGSTTEEKCFNKEDITVSLVEGTYYNFTGLSKRGIFPAILFNEQAYGFGERLPNKEKKWVVDLISKYSTNN